ncbi:MAG: hypothetical protein GC191_03945 [Azospirillum sp.]|nr:hypothetical protein [Azospirillum sp.]
MTDSPPRPPSMDRAGDVLDAVAAALRRAFAGKEQITRGELEAALLELRGTWRPTRSTPSASADNTRQAAGHEAAGPARIDYVPDVRRKDFLTRLVFSRILSRVPVRQVGIVAGAGVFYPRLLAPGIQANLRALFQPRELFLLNQHARKIFADLGTDHDDTIWPVISASRSMTVRVDRIFIRILLAFKNFNVRKWEFIRILTTQVEPRLCQIDEDVFFELFDALFHDYRAMVASTDGLARLDSYYGQTCGEELRAVFATYHRQRQALVLGDYGRCRPEPVAAAKR